MRDPLLVSGRDSIGQLERNFGKTFGRQPPWRNDRIQRDAFDEFHRQKPDALRLFGREDRDDMRMVERGDGAGFAGKPFEPHRVACCVRAQHFERDVTPQ
jgi:hypothetical protein